MKRNIFLFLIIILISGSNIAFSQPGAPIKIKEKFHQQFPEIQNASFYNLGDCYQAIFDVGGEFRERVYYNPEGEVYRTIKYYKGDDLNPFIKVKLNKEFKGKQISHVTEYQSNSEHYYYIALEDNEHWYFAQYSDSGFFLSEKVLKKN